MFAYCLYIESNKVKFSLEASLVAVYLLVACPLGLELIYLFDLNFLGGLQCCPVQCGGGWSSLLQSS